MTLFYKIKSTFNCIELLLLLRQIGLFWFFHTISQLMQIFLSIEFLKCLFSWRPVHTLLVTFVVDKLFILWLLWVSKFQFYSFWFFSLFLWCLFRICLSFFIHLRFSYPFSYAHCVTLPNQPLLYQFPPSIG